MELFNGDCLNILPQLEDNSVDLFFTDLPYGQTACKWDNKIDLEELWVQLNRVCKINCPMIFTTTTKYGVELINSNPKNFRYDLIWVKSAPAGFLNAKKMPMRKHEMIYIFYRKLPFYNIEDNHTHKFLNSKNGMKGQDNLIYGKEVKQVQNKQYDPPLPTSVIKAEDDKKTNYNTLYGNLDIPDHPSSGSRWDPPLPTSVIKEEISYTRSYKGIYGDKVKRDDRKNKIIYDPPLPTSVVKEEIYGKDYLDKKEDFKGRNGKPRYDPPLPTSVVSVYNTKTEYNNSLYPQGTNGTLYDPPLPNSILEIKSEKGKHQTQKPTALMEWILKYYSKEGDVVLDCCMGSGSMGVACNNLNRNFIGIELNEEIFKDAEERLNTLQSST